MEPDPHFSPLLKNTLGHALECLEKLPDAPVGPGATLEELRERLGKPLPDQECAPNEVITHLVEDVQEGLTGNAGGRFFGWVHVDGAFGLWAAASPEYQHLTAGVADADSWATDGHK